MTTKKELKKLEKEYCYVVDLHCHKIYVPHKIYQFSVINNQLVGRCSDCGKKITSVEQARPELL